MADVDELFSCFDDEAEEKQPTVPVVMEVDEKSLQEVENSWVFLFSHRTMWSKTEINFRNVDEISHKRPLESDDASEQAKKLRVESLLDDIK